jgi:hypothetical protein
MLKKLEPVEILKWGIFSIQVCAANSLSEKEVMDITNVLQPAGTEHGWGTIDHGDRQPVPCADHPNRTHYVIDC